MGNDAPYMYSNVRASETSLEFNPRAYTQASYAASMASEQRSSRQPIQGPLIDFNQHPDTWMVVAQEKPRHKPLSPRIRSKIVVTRWLQFVLRLLQLVTVLGLFVCVILINSTVGLETYIIRIPPACDLLLSAYACYHLVKGAHRRTPVSSASYNFYMLCMDCALIPFYVYIAVLAQANYGSAVDSSGRWTTFFNQDFQTNYVFFFTFVAAAAVGGLHLISIAFDITLLIWFRSISRLPPDMNPLEPTAAAKKASKHKHKNSELTASSVDTDSKHMANISGSTLHLGNQSTVSLPKGFSAADSGRAVPFSQSRVNLDGSYNPHNRDSARMSGFYSQAGSARGSRADVRSMHSRSASRSPSRSRSQSRSRAGLHNQEHDPMPDIDRVTSPDTFTSATSKRNSRASVSPAPNAAVPAYMTKQQEQKSLLNDNWYTFDDGSDIGTPRLGTPQPKTPYVDSPEDYNVLPPIKQTQAEQTKVKETPVPETKSKESKFWRKSKQPQPETETAPAVPVKNKDRPKKEPRITEKEVDVDEDDEDIGRALTMGDSIYGDNDNMSMHSRRYYGDLSAGMRSYSGNGRVISRSGADIGDASMTFDEDRGRNVSGAIAEEGRSQWEMRRREVSGTA